MPSVAPVLVMRIFAVALLSVVALGAAAAVRESLPQTVRAEYSVSRGAFRVGTITETFQRDGERYRITSETVAVPALSWLVRDRLVVTSEGLITATGLRPDSYAFLRDKSPRKNIRASFSWHDGVMTSEHDGKTAKVALEQGTQDRLSILYQFMVAPPGLDRVEAWMTNGRHVARYAYERRGTTKIATPNGTYEALHVHRKDAQDGSEVDLWLAQDRHFVPLRIRLTHKDGTQDEQSLLSLAVH